MMIASRILGTILAQAFFIPGAWYVARLQSLFHKTVVLICEDGTT